MSYMQLSVDYTAWHSGKTYQEEVFLPLEEWKKIEEKFQPFLYLHGLDGKHSEAKVDIDIDEVSSEYLQKRVSSSQDGDNLFYHVWEFLDESYPDSYLLDIQKEVERLRQYEQVIYTVHAEDRQTLDDFVAELQKKRIG